MTDGRRPVAAARPRVTPWVPIALIASLVPCPPVSGIGALLGMWALREIRCRPDRRGRGGAIAAIAIGTVLTLGWLVFVGTWWHVNVRRPMLDGPLEPLRRGLAGDVAGFRAAFVDPGSDEEASAFLADVSRCCGDLVAISPARRGPDRAAKDLDPAGIVIPYLFRFDRRSVPADALFVVSEGGRLPFVLEWGWVRVESEEGDLVYPVSAHGAGAEPSRGSQ